MISCMAERTHYSAISPGGLSGKAPQDFGTGRRCACGTKILRYRKGDKCGLCEDNPERQAKFAAPPTQETTPMLGIKKWKSRAHPDGCSECPDDEKFSRRHAARGLCTKHYGLARDAEKNAAAEPAHPGTVRLHEVVDTGIDLPATPEEIESGKASKTIMPGESDPRLDGRLDRERAAAYNLNPEGCPRDAGETCCGNPDECNPDRDPDSRPEPDSDATEGEWPPAEIQRWLNGEGDAQEVNSVLEAIALCDFARDGGRPDAPLVLGDELAAEIGVDVCKDGRSIVAFDLSKAMYQADLVDFDGGIMFPVGDKQATARKLIGLHERAMGLYVGSMKHAERALGAYNGSLRNAELAAGAARDVEAELGKLGVKMHMAEIQEPVGEFDPEIAAMDIVREALLDLDRDAQIRVMRYVSSRYGIDRPAPEPVSDPLSD